MKQKTLLPRRIISAALSLALVLPASLALLGFAEAKESLPHVEEIKKSKTEFNILEIVPAVGQGEIGYYIPGQEPWDAALAAITTPEERQKEFVKIADGLVKEEIIGKIGSTSSPLTRTNETLLYQEAYPWSNNGAGPGDGFTEFTLDEEVTIEKIDGYVTRYGSGSKDYTVISSEKYEYRYVGKDKGNHVFEYNPRWPFPCSIITKVVFRKLACTNNNWFLKSAFDWEPGEAAPKLLVNSKTAKTVTPEDIRDCDLLVLSNGYAPGGGLAKYTKDNDITPDVKEAILAAVQKTTGADWDYGLPIVVDSRIASNSTGATNLKAVASKLSESKTNSFVKDSVFYFKPDSTDRKALVTMNFNKPYAEGTYDKPTSPFNEVYTTAEAANKGREDAAKISTKVSLGTIFRHLVGLAALRDARLRRELHVLDIEPGDTTALTVDQVAKWTGFNAKNIKITTMSTSEFIGKIEDVSEVYDMVYIGDTPEANATRKTWLPGTYLYANIGAERPIMGEASGLTDAEYWDNPFFEWVAGKSYYALRTISVPKTRYSGNDLTPAKRAELENFAKAGNPVVVANEIADRTGELAEVKLEAKASATVNSDGTVNLKVVPSVPMPSDVKLTYQWSSKDVTNSSSGSYIDISGATSSEYVAKIPAGKDKADIYYRCDVTYTVDESNIADKATSGTMQVFFNRNSNTDVIASDKDQGTPTTIPVRPAKKIAIKLDTVDNCSYMYEFLNNIKELENVQRAGSISGATLANLSKTLHQPKLNLHLTESPTPYAMTNSGAVTSLKPDTPGGDSFSLNFKFRIAAGGNAKADTRYTCSLLLDNDADGRYMEGAEKNEAVTTGFTITNGDSPVMNTELKAGVEYTAKYIIPTDLKGLVSWKLKLSQNDDALIHDSAHGYTHVPVEEKDRKEIHVLQINTGRTAGQDYGAGKPPYDGLSLETKAEQESGSRQTFKDLFAKVQDFKIGIQTIKTSDANGIGKSAINNSFDGQYYSEIGKFLASYDMLIIGIDECYNELSKDTADAIVAALNGGQPVMYTHDTTSLANVPEIYMDSKFSSGYLMLQKPKFYYGYYFNNILRDAVGLDRYGVTTEKYGGTRMSNPSLENSGIVAANYKGITEPQKTDILADKYSLAYEPGRGKSELTGETQGFTNYSAPIWGDNNCYTSHASQVNEGQITCYPFDVNTKDFGGGLTSDFLDKTDTNAIDILKTHQQYYQTNMNADDIVVWYCLKEDGSNKVANITGTPKYAQNDVANAYYIYTQGNAIYTGFGHTTEGIKEPEAKLFINAMIAAYKSAQISAGVRFTDSTGAKDMESFIVPADDDTILRPKTDAKIGDDRKLYFTTSGAAAKASFSYGENATPITTVLPVYKVEGDGKQDSMGTLTPGAYYVKLDELLSAISTNAGEVDNKIGNSGLKITIAVSAGGKSATDVLTLRKIMLFPLN